MGGSAFPRIAAFNPVVPDGKNPPEAKLLARSTLGYCRPKVYVIFERRDGGNTLTGDIKTIRFDQAGFMVERLLALRRVFARRISFGMTAVRAILAGFPALLNSL
jgi:hypothetical protein